MLSAIANHRLNEFDYNELIEITIVLELMKSGLVKDSFKEFDKFLEFNNPRITSLVLEYKSIGIVIQSRSNLKRADEFLDLKQYKKALKYYQKVDLYLCPNHIVHQCHHNAGLALTHLEQYNEAITQFERALKAVPNHNASTENLAFLHMMIDNFNEALRIFDEILQHDSKNKHHNLPYILFWKADCLLRLKRYTEAEETARLASHVETTYTNSTSGDVVQSELSRESKARLKEILQEIAESRQESLHAAQTLANWRVSPTDTRLASSPSESHSTSSFTASAFLSHKQRDHQPEQSLSPIAKLHQVFAPQISSMFGCLHSSASVSAVSTVSEEDMTSLMEASGDDYSSVGETTVTVPSTLPLSPAVKSTPELQVVSSSMERPLTRVQPRCLNIVELQSIPQYRDRDRTAGDALSPLRDAATNTTPEDEGSDQLGFILSEQVHTDETDDYFVSPFHHYTEEKDAVPIALTIETKMPTNSPIHQHPLEGVASPLSLQSRLHREMLMAATAQFSCTLEQQQVMSHQRNESEISALSMKTCSSEIEVTRTQPQVAVFGAAVARSEDVVQAIPAVSTVRGVAVSPSSSAVPARASSHVNSSQHDSFPTDSVSNDRVAVSAPIDHSKQQATECPITSNSAKYTERALPPLPTSHSGVPPRDRNPTPVTEEETLLPAAYREHITVTDRRTSETQLRQGDERREVKTHNTQSSIPADPSTSNPLTVTRIESNRLVLDVDSSQLPPLRINSGNDDSKRLSHGATSVSAKAVDRVMETDPIAILERIQSNNRIASTGYRGGDVNQRVPPTTTGSISSSDDSACSVKGRVGAVKACTLPEKVVENMTRIEDILSVIGDSGIIARRHSHTVSSQREMPVFVVTSTSMPVTRTKVSGVPPPAVSTAATETSTQPTVQTQEKTPVVQSVPAALTSAATTSRMTSSVVTTTGSAGSLTNATIKPVTLRTTGLLPTLSQPTITTSDISTAVDTNTQKLSITTTNFGQLKTPLTRTPQSDCTPTSLDPASLYDRSKLRAVTESPRPSHTTPTVNVAESWASLLSPSKRRVVASLVDTQEPEIINDVTIPLVVSSVIPQLSGSKPTHISRFYSPVELTAPGPYPSDVHPRYRELYLTDSDFERVLRMTKAAWDLMPQWKQTTRKKETGLF